MTTPPSRAPRLDPEVRRELILDAVERVVATTPSTLVTFAQIASAAGISRGLVHNYFSDRTTLMLALAERAQRRLGSEIESLLGPEPDIRGQVRALVTAYQHVGETHPGCWRLLAESGLWSHGIIRDGRGERIAGLCHRWGGSRQAKAAATTVIYVLEMGLADSIGQAEQNDLQRFLCESVESTLGTAGS